MHWLIRLGAGAALLTMASCGREERLAGRPPDAGARPSVVRVTGLVPGTEPWPIASVNPHEGDEQAFATGTRLYQWFNCGGCHFEGGGGIGPPLMDDDWIYGGAPPQIFSSIASGRPNGMPAYGDMLTTEQIWQIELFVASLSERANGRGNAAVEDSP